MKKKQLPAKKYDPWDEIKELQKRMGQSADADPKDVERLRHLALETPGFLSDTNSLSQGLRQRLIESMSCGSSRSYLLAEMDKLKREFDYDSAPPLEQLLIDHILTVRLRLIHTEAAFEAFILNQSVPLTEAGYWETRLTTTQARFLRAIEALARVRRLSRNTPTLQINIARDGGKQVNMQGEVRAQSSEVIQ